MQKKIIALAFAGLVSGVTCAQSNVTVYGVMDAYTGVAKADNAAGNQKQTVVNSGGISSSRLGFMGEEALGNGLKAVFKLELGSLDISGATNNIGNTRQAFVGLASDKLGTVRIGRAQTFGWDWAVKYDVLGQSTAFSPMASVGKNFIYTSGGLGRQPNAVSYLSPSLSGLVIRGDYAAGEQVTGTSGAAGYKSAQNYYSLGADYDNGPLSIGGGIAQIQDYQGTLNDARAQKIGEWVLGGIYDFKLVKTFLSYQQSKTTPLTGNDVKNKLWSAGVAVPIGAGSLNIAYVDFKNDAAAQAKAKGFGVDYEYSLSKRTTAYAGWTQISNGANAAFATGGMQVAPSADRNASFYGVGMRHRF